MQNQWLQHFSADGLQPQLLSADQDYLPPMITDGSSHLLNGYWEDPNNLHGFDDSELAETSSPQNPNTSLAATGTDNMDLNSNLTNSSTFFSPNMDCYATNAEKKN
ncbi:hypothetical protein BC936DRAFT_148544 [Jimgerdemannia flammicorona]|uniref:Uncharacterized protein n=1 Tax=Jimgerdemannia flammicorona TaxID=994334 RepID=A0A433D2T7_9FUNG|nr:hypothetical protein BC936DRAFT_148544 [Jimgerdemannia flammicorona]